MLGLENPEPEVPYDQCLSHQLVLSGRRGGDHDPDDRLQRGAGDLQEPQVSSVGPRRPNLHPTLLALLLLQHGRSHLRRGLGRQGPY